MVKMTNRRAVDVDDRNYAAEAKNLMKEVHGNQVYQLYEIVVNQLKHSVSDTRLKELRAVKSACEDVEGIDRPRLRKIITGYGSTMAADATPRDGFTKPNKKKV